MPTRCAPIDGFAQVLNGWNPVIFLSAPAVMAVMNLGDSAGDALWGKTGKQHSSGREEEVRVCSVCFALSDPLQSVFCICFVLICVASDMCLNLLISSFFSRLESSGLSLLSSWPMIALEFGSWNPATLVTMRRSDAIRSFCAMGGG